MALFNPLKKSVFIQKAGELIEVLKDSERVQEALNETQKKQSNSTKKRPRHFKNYCEGINEVPDWLKSEEWINKRGFKVGGEPWGMFITVRCQETLLYSLHEAIPHIPGADLHFKGHYFQELSHIPYYLQPLSYFQMHGLVPQGPAVAKLLVNDQFFVDYYLIPSILNISQRQSLQADWVSNFKGEIYSCDPANLPTHLKRKKQLEESKLPVPEKATAYLYDGAGFIPLYRPSEAIKPKPDLKVVSNIFESPSGSFEVTPLKKGEWWSNPKQYVMLDTETTGTTNQDEIIQLAIVNLDKEVVYKQYFKPSVKSSKGAYETHHISDAFLQDKPLWKDCWAEIEALLQDKIILIQNAKFDIEKIQQTCAKYHLQGTTVFQVKDTIPYFYQMVGVKGLKKVMTVLEIEHDDSKLHDAVEDCVKTIECLNRTLTL